MVKDTSDGKQDGREMFRELLRNFPTVRVEDYFKGGRWQTDTMALDIELILAHRRESGAPEPPPIEEIEMPEFPSGDGWGSRTPPPAPAAPAAPPRSSSTPAAPSRPPLTPTPPKRAPSQAEYTAQGDLGGKAQMELRLIADFVRKWKLDPTRTKLLLARLTPTRRRTVISTFEAPATNGVSPTAALERFISQSDQGAAPSSGGAPRPSAPKAPPKQVTSAGAKRPLSVSAAEEGETKRPRPAGYAGSSAPARPSTAASLNGPSSLAARPKEATKPQREATKPSGKTGGGGGIAALGAKPGDLIKNLLGGL
eukprot:TRINITY_DN19928_c0_g1_i1.p1 TRINITY_DN19928_c0_g1~~TRINITY_DN19928_c0_g1_i1.p1  ORF type:complete len:311 (+),score=63.80 TRINITY_DN19928_c0_g1_i1:137-1069(+)